MIAIIKAWLKKNLAWLLGALAIFVMVVCFVSGCQFHKNRFPCPEPTTHTVIIHDTLIHQITNTVDHYHLKVDTIIYNDTIIQPVDTAAILRDHFTLHVYSREWKDSLINVWVRDTITENHFLQNDFRYQILRPQQIVYNTVDNSVNYSRYLYGGLDVPLYYMDGTEVELMFAFEKGYIGGGYAPLAKSGSLKAGFALWKIK